MKENNEKKQTMIEPGISSLLNRVAVIAIGSGLPMCHQRSGP
jgi:hypothetical protein